MKTFIFHLIIAAAFCSCAVATPVTYFIWDDWGGAFADVEKDSTNPQDENMCWTAAAANILEWTRWGEVADMTRADEMFAYYRDHFTPDFGSAVFAWQWWFTGDYQMQGHPYQSQVDVPGGGFWPEVDFYSNFYYVYADQNTMLALRSLLHQGWGTTIVIQSGLWAHQIALWGLDYDADAQTFSGIWITDSEDDMDSQDPLDELKYYGVELIGEQWYLQDYKVDNSHIEQIAAIPHMTLVIPEPATTLLLLAGTTILLTNRRRVAR